jgi:hypothetical protein
MLARMTDAEHNKRLQEERVLELTKGHAKATTYARQLFLYGDGDGKPITKLKELARRTGLTYQTVQERSRQWMLEREEMLKRASNMSFIAANEIANMKHSEDMEFLRTCMDGLREEIFNLGDLQDRLETITDRLAKLMADEGGDPTKVVGLFQTYFKSAGSRRALMADWLKYKAMWDSKIGVDTQQDLAVDAAKTHNRKMIQKGLRNDESQTTMTPVGPDRNIFRR